MWFITLLSFIRMLRHSNKLRHIYYFIGCHPLKLILPLLRGADSRTHDAQHFYRRYCVKQLDTRLIATRFLERSPFYTENEKNTPSQ